MYLVSIFMKMSFLLTHRMFLMCDKIPLLNQSYLDIVYRRTVNAAHIGR